MVGPSWGIFWTPTYWLLDTAYMDLSHLREILTRARIVPELTDILRPEAEFYLVGGALRDLLLGAEVQDFDFAGPVDPTGVARDFAGRIGGHWFFLDEKRRQSRVVLRQRSETSVYDFAPYRGPNLAADLRLRDFTVNALAVRLPAAGEVFDPLGGLDDLAARRLRECSADVFLDDPLRVLKGVRHAVTLGFHLDGETTERMRQAAGLIGRVAPERVRTEVAMIFAAEPITSGLSLMHSLNLAAAVFGPPAEGGSAGAGAALAARMEEILSVFGQGELAAVLAEEFEAGVNRAVLLKLAAFLRGYRPSGGAGASDRLRLGRRAAAALGHLLALPADRAAEASLLPAHPRGRALWAVGLGGSAPENVLFLSLLLGEPPAAAAARFLPVLRDYLSLARDGRIPDLVDGDWVRENLGIAAGPPLGAALAALRREEIGGRVRTPEEARSFLSKGREKD